MEYLAAFIILIGMVVMLFTDPNEERSWPGIVGVIILFAGLIIALVARENKGFEKGVRAHAEHSAVIDTLSNGETVIIRIEPKP